MGTPMFYNYTPINLIHIALKHISIGFRKECIYNTKTLLNFIGSIIILLLQISVWSFLLDDESTAGYTKKSIITYFVVMYFVEIWLSLSCDSWLTRRIISGDISYDLLKPIQILFFIPFEFLSQAIYRLVVTGLPIFVIISWLYDINISPIHILSSMPLLIISMVFWIIFEYSIGCLSFHTKAYWGLFSLKSALLMFFTGRLLPLEFYPKWLFNIISESPFSIPYYHLAHSLIGNSSGSFSSKIIFILFLKESVYVILFSFILMVLWKKGLKNLSIQGG